MKKITLIGAGNMATAIIKGMLKGPDAPEYRITVYDVFREKAEALGPLGVRAAGTAAEAVSGADIVILAVKPQNIREALEEIRPALPGAAVVVSIAAGISCALIKGVLGEDRKVVPVMPNTPLLLGKGASALARVEPVTEEEFRSVCRIFSASGSVSVIPEDKMKEVIALNGSSPAFIYLFAKSFVEYAVSVGIDEDAALSLFCQSLTGSAEMMLRSGYSLDRLIEMVSSKGGTTIAGLEELYRHDLKQAVMDACEACTARAYELSRGE